MSAVQDGVRYSHDNIWKPSENLLRIDMAFSNVLGWVSFSFTLYYICT